MYGIQDGNQRAHIRAVSKILKRDGASLRTVAKLSMRSLGFMSGQDIGLVPGFVWILDRVRDWL